MLVCIWTWPQELCARENVFFARGVVQGLVVLLERCQKLCKRDSFKRVVQTKIFCQRDVKSCAKEIISKELRRSVFFARDV